MLRNRTLPQTRYLVRDGDGREISGLPYQNLELLLRYAHDSSGLGELVCTPRYSSCA